MGHYINCVHPTFIACNKLVVRTLVAVVIRVNEIVLHYNVCQLYPNKFCLLSSVTHSERIASKGMFHAHE